MFLTHGYKVFFINLFGDERSIQKTVINTDEDLQNKYNKICYNNYNKEFRIKIFKSKTFGSRVNLMNPVDLFPFFIDCLSKLSAMSEDNMEYTTKSFCLVHIFCRNMDDFGLINGEYKKLFRQNPPAR